MSLPTSDNTVNVTRLGSILSTLWAKLKTALSGKQDKLTSQTAYSAKGTATKVPQITTNSLGQVTGITEVTISGVTPASHASTATTYGIGTTSTYGHVKLVTGDMNGATNVDGAAVSMNHTHSQYAPKASPALTGTPTAPTAADGTNTTQIATTAFVQSAVTQGLSVSDAMVYKGTITLGATSPGGLTVAADKGHTYKVVANGNTKAGYVDGVKVEAGDMVICNADSTAAATSSNYSTIAAKWDFVQGNTDGVVVGPASATSGNVVLFDGATGKLVQDGGTLGTAAFKNVASSGNASTTQVVMGNDSRLTDSRTPTAHTHGNIQNDGTLQTNDVTIANGAKLVITDANNSNKVARASAAFDGSTTSKVLTQKGTFESMSSITPVQYYLPSMAVTSDDFDPSLYSRYQMIGGANGTYAALYLMYDITEFCDGTIVNISAEMSSFSGTIIEHRVGGYPYERITNVTMAVSYGNPLTSSNCRFLSSDSPRLYPVIVKETVERNATWTTGAYTFTEGAVPTAVSGASSYRYTDIACSAGQEICVSANISSTYKSWAFLDASGKVISISSTNKYNGTLTAPENAAALRVQISSSHVNYTTCGLKLSTPKYYLAIRTTSGSQSHVTYCGRWYTRKTASASYAARPLLGIYRSNLGEESAANLPAGYEEMAGPTYAIKAGTSVKLATARELAVSLSNTSTTTTFDGSADVTNIKVTGTLPLSKGGTGATTKKAAEYAINGNIQESAAAMSDDNRIVFSRIDTQSAENGVFIYKTGTTMWNYFKDKMTSDTGVNISGNAATATKATQDSDGNAINTTYLKQLYQAEYGVSTFADIYAAITAKKIVYCKVPGATASAARMAFLAYVNVSNPPTSSSNIEFQYYRSDSSGTGDSVFVYTITNNNNTWTTVERAASSSVKGNAESTYRTGQVNLTPANLGISDQTAYSAKGTATKVPQITTNSLGQVTSISEVTISGVTPASHAHGNITNGGAITTNATIETNDKLIISDANASNVLKRTSVSFDTTKSNLYLSQDGTFSSVKEADLAWGGNFRTSLSPAELALLPRNILANPPVDYIKYERTTDGGTTWTTVDVAGADIKKLFNLTQRTATINAGTTTTDETVLPLQRGRITIVVIPFGSTTYPSSGSWCYCNAKRLILYVSTAAASNTHCVVETQIGSDFIAGNDTWTTLGDYSIRGDGGWNSIPFSTTLGGSQSQLASRVVAIRLTFWAPNKASSTAGGRVAIKAIGIIPETVWKTAANCAWTGNLTAPVNLENDGTGSIAGVTTQGSASNSVARHVWFSSDGAETKRAHSDNFNYTPSTNTISANISGNAATATNVVAEAASSNTNQRHIWFSDSSTETKRAKSDSFNYVSSTNTVTANISGTAAKATGDADGTNIKQNYMKTTSGTKGLTFGSSTTIGTVNGQNVNLSLPDTELIVDITGETWSVVNLIQTAAAINKLHVRYICKSDAGSANITGTPALPSGGSSFVLDATAVRFVSDNDYVYELYFYMKTVLYPFVTQVTKNGSGAPTMDSNGWRSTLKTMAIHGDLQDSTFTHQMENQTAGSRNNSWYYNLGLRPFSNYASGSYWPNGRTYWLTSFRSQVYGPDWVAGSHSSGIAFGGGDTKGAMSIRYSKDSNGYGKIAFAGGAVNNSSGYDNVETAPPMWWFHIQGKHNTTYTLPPMDTTDTSKYAISITGKSGGVTATRASSTSTAGRYVWISDNADDEKRVYDDKLLYRSDRNRMTTNITGSSTGLTYRHSIDQQQSDSTQTYFTVHRIATFPSDNVTSQISVGDNSLILQLFTKGYRTSDYGIVLIKVKMAGNSTNPYVNINEPYNAETNNNKPTIEVSWKLRSPGFDKNTTIQAAAIQDGNGLWHVDVFFIIQHAWQLTVFNRLGSFSTVDKMVGTDDGWKLFSSNYSPNPASSHSNPASDSECYEAINGNGAYVASMKLYGATSYINAATITEDSIVNALSTSGSEIGSSLQPVYFNASGRPVAIPFAEVSGVAQDYLTLRASFAKYAPTAGEAGTATTATKLTTGAVGSATRPVYFNAEGAPVAISYKSGEDVGGDSCLNLTVSKAYNARYLNGYSLSVGSYGGVTNTIYFD